MEHLRTNENKRRVVTRTIHYQVRKDLLDTELGRIFDTWSVIPYTSYHSMTKETDYASLLRQKINNIYTNLFDETVCLKKDYLNALRLPKTLYFKWLKGAEFTPEEVTAAIDDAIAASLLIKEQSAKEKMILSWEDYMTLVEKCFSYLFEHYKCLDEYEDKSQLTVQSELWQEDNYCIRYLCVGLEGFFRNYQKEYYGLPKSTRYHYARCKSCFGLYEKKHNRQVYCQACSAQKKKDRYKKYNKKRKPQLENTLIPCIL